MHMQFDLNSVLIILAAMAGLWRTEHLNSSIITLAKEVGKLEGRYDGLQKSLDRIDSRIDAMNRPEPSRIISTGTSK